MMISAVGEPGTLELTDWSSAVPPKVTQDRFYGFFESQSLTCILGRRHLFHEVTLRMTQHNLVKNLPTVAHDA